MLNDKKLPLPAQRFLTLGYEVDTVALIVTLPANKLEKRRSQVSAALAEVLITVHQLEKLQGGLVHLSFVVVGGRWHTQPIWDKVARKECGMCQGDSTVDQVGQHHHGSSD